MSIFTTYRPVAAPLRPDRWFGGPGFRFGLPWPWEDAPGAVTVVDQSGSSSAPTLLSLIAPRSAGAGLAVVWAEPDAIDVNAMAATFGRSSAAGRGARLLSERKALVARSRALVVELLEPTGDHVIRVMIGGGPGTLFAEFAFPSNAADGYRPHVETALGTWAWG